MVVIRQFMPGNRNVSIFYFAAAAKWLARQLSLTDRLRNACSILFHDFSVLVFPSHSANICLQAVLESCLVSCSILFNSVDWTPNWRPISNHLVDILGVTISVRLAISVWILDDINKLVIATQVILAYIYLLHIISVSQLGNISMNYRYRDKSMQHNCIKKI